MKPFKAYTYETSSIQCLSCQLTKTLEEFQYMALMPNHRHYNCMECEAKITFETGINLTTAAQHSKISRRDIYKNPTLLEANRLVKSLLRYIKKEVVNS